MAHHEELQNPESFPATPPERDLFLVATLRGGRIVNFRSMSNSEEIHSHEVYPVTPRNADFSLQKDVQSKKENDMGLSERPMRPVASMKVEFWHQGEKASDWKPAEGARRQNYAKRADQFGLLLLGTAVVLFAVIVLVLYLNNRSYVLKANASRETTPAAVDFYQGNHVFSEKVAAEKAAKEGHPVPGVSSVDDAVEVSLRDQMSSMSSKMEKIRSEKQEDEVPPPLPDKVPQSEILKQLKPVKAENFESTLEFNGALSKTLQPTNGK